MPGGTRPTRAASPHRDNDNVIGPVPTTPGRIRCSRLRFAENAALTWAFSSSELLSSGFQQELPGQQAVTARPSRIGRGTCTGHAPTVMA